jgi:hypothetical protein
VSLSIWLTDRTRYSTGTGRCARERYLRNHFGPTGYGIVRKAESLPLMTGSYWHVILEHFWTYLKEQEAIPPIEFVREAIQDGIQQYEKRIVARGFRGLLQSEHTDLIIKEQQTLIAGLAWMVYRQIVPWLHTHYRVLQAELETVYMLDCTCGLGSGVLDPLLHDQRGCQGIGQMLKQDLVAAKREGGTLAYFEGKSTGWGGDNWAPQWETKPQLSIGSFGIPERYGKEVSELYIIAGYKGARKTTKAKDPFEQDVTRQESPFCYGYCKPGNPPLGTDDWKPAYEWVDEYGAVRRVSQAHKKRGVWELPESDWPAWTKRERTDLSPIEWWTQYALPSSVAEKQVFLVGPMNRQDVQILALKRQIVGEERHWQQILWQLYELQQAGHSWTSEEFQQQLDYLVPASWDCRRFGTKHECEYLGLCLRKQGWEDPLSAGFVARRPHHATELDVAISRGLLPEQSEDEESDDDA